jgi:hypothetical protein
MARMNPQNPRRGEVVRLIQTEAEMDSVTRTVAAITRGGVALKRVA